MAAATIVHDTSEAVELCPPYGLYLKPITKMTISVALPQLKQPGKSISNWEVMERLKAMVQQHQFSTLRIAKSTMDFIRFEGEVENRGLVKAFLACLDGKTIKLSGFSDILRVRAAEFKIDFPTRHDWDSFFRDAKDMNETLPGERPDTIHLEGLPCKWFAAREPGAEKPSERVLVQVFEKFGAIRHVDIPMLDPYREEMTGRSFHTFSFGGHLNFEAYIQYCEYAGFIQAMSALRCMKLMYKGEDGKSSRCNIKVSFDSTKHLSDASIKKRQLERQKLQELEQQREEQKRREKEAEERRRAQETKQKELQEQERERRREEKLRRREQRQRQREQRRSQKQLDRLQAREQRQLHERIRLEERKLLLAQRNLQSIRLVAELLSRAKAAKQQEQERRDEQQRRQQLEERRRVQAAELRRVEEEKERALGLQRRERELRGRLLSILLSKQAADPQGPAAELGAAHADLLLRPVLDILHSVTRAGHAHAHARSAHADATGAQPAGGAPGTPAEKRGPGVLACIPHNAPPPPPPPKPAPPAAAGDPEPGAPGGDARASNAAALEQDKCNREPSPGAARRGGSGGGGDPRDAPAAAKAPTPEPPRARSRARHPGAHKERRAHKKRSRAGSSPRRRRGRRGGRGSASPEPTAPPPPAAQPRARRGSRSRSRSRSRSSAGERRARRARGSRDRGSRHRRGDRSRSGSAGRHRSTWNR
ncbi:LOW QUALITY PROTEIN: A-kinase anchor protein 17A [Sorex fumeus]|uniref:LOW QUALITY PROTEIN: A-kinase anchor protein 17A n=1 Tax=Sorex fumeus TaxID=62283 RepID=UPI0024AD1EF0|nr:LOW QUALITY PROTEIN: A-kinase anchor protein 17A [Sorex fumeus]